MAVFWFTRLRVAKPLYTLSQSIIIQDAAEKRAIIKTAIINY